MTNAVTARPTSLPDLKMAELEKLETRVREGLQSFVEVGRALVEIRERRGGWVRVGLGGGLGGWLPEASLGPVTRWPRPAGA